VIERPGTQVSGLFVTGDPVGNWKRSSSQTGRCKRQRKIGVPQLETAVGGRNEIEDASRVWWECARPDWTRRFIRGLAEDAKFELSRGVIIDPAVKAGFGETRRRGLTALPPAPGIWLPVFGSSTQFYFHSLGTSSTCECSLCEHRSTTASLTVGL
jgi:hypothetical protein